MARGPNFWFTVGVAMFAAVGTFLFGFDTGIVTTTIAHQSWRDYMNDPNTAITGAVVSLYIAGEAIGSIIQTVMGDRIGRLRLMQIMSVLVTIGSILQTASQNMGMFLAGRHLAGIAVGAMIGTVSVYLSEISLPQHRGIIGGLAGLGAAFGILLANWVGFSASFAPYGELQWRLPLALQIPWGLIMLGGLCTFMPESPRYFIRTHQPEKALASLMSMRRGTPTHEIESEYEVMRAQITFEMEREVPSLRAAWHLYKKRVLAAVAIQCMTSLTGVNVIQYFQTVLYKSLGMDPKMVLALAGVYGTISFIANLITSKFLLDRWGRRKMLLTALLLLSLVLIYTAVMQRHFQHTDNRLGKGFTILGIYLYCVFWYGLLGSSSWLYCAEVLPVMIRSKAMGFACACHFIVNIGVTQAGPIALANISENYYYVFVGFNVFFLIVGWFNWPETKQKSLEEIAESFGDKTVIHNGMIDADAKLPAVNHDEVKDTRV